METPTLRVKKTYILLDLNFVVRKGSCPNTRREDPSLINGVSQVVVGKTLNKDNVSLN